MIFNGFLWIFVMSISRIFVYSDDSSMFIVTKDDCDDRVIQCNSTHKALTPVCGTDRITYSSYCEVISKQCDGEVIHVNYLGPCIEKSSCFTAQRTSPPALRPKCNPDGTFAQTQCHLASGYCWCVKPDGQRIANTGSYHQKPPCDHPSPIPIEEHDEKPLCTAQELQDFASNLLINFEIEFIRAGVSLKNAKAKIVSWKFDLLDYDSDDFLNKKELEVLLRIAENFVVPNRCSRSFTKFCDADRDMKLSLNEWSVCLTNETTILKRNTPLIMDEPSDVSDDEDVSLPGDCLSKRQTALKYKQKTAQKQIFVPECTDGGEFHEVQCYAGVCWCVKPKTGEAIPRTSSRNGRPNCSGGVVKGKRMMQGCSHRKQKELFEEIMKVIRERFQKGENGANGDSSVIAMFRYLDVNQNGVIQRGKEWKRLRMIVPANRCAKKLPKFCDFDGDFKISMNEWFECLGLQRKSERGVNPASILHSS